MGSLGRGWNPSGTTRGLRPSSRPPAAPASSTGAWWWPTPSARCGCWRPASRPRSTSRPRMSEWTCSSHTAVARCANGRARPTTGAWPAPRPPPGRTPIRWRATRRCAITLSFYPQRVDGLLSRRRAGTGQRRRLLRRLDHGGHHRTVQGRSGHGRLVAPGAGPERRGLILRAIQASRCSKCLRPELRP